MPDLFTFSTDIIHFDCFDCTSSTSVLPECNFGVAPYLKSRDNMTERSGFWDTLLIRPGNHLNFDYIGR